MARILIGNFDFEHRLADPHRQLPAKLSRINAELATSWLAIAEDGDYLWTPQPIDLAFFEHAASVGLPHVIPVTSFDQAPPGVECVPWGWTDDIRELCQQRGWTYQAPSDAVVRGANSRRLSAGLEREWRVGLDFAGEARSLAEVDRLLDHHDPAGRWLIKAEYGMSGRERLVGTGALTEAQKNWVAKRLAADGVVFFEPWVERLEEVGIQIHVPQTGEPVLIDVVPMLVDDRGQYAGSWFATRHNLFLAQDLMTGKSGVDVALRAARHLQQMGYHGPLGIDSMRYRAADQSIRIRPLQDINARWTMGRLSLGLRRLLKSRNAFALWCHSSGDRLDAKTARILTTMRLRRFVQKNRGLLPESNVRSILSKDTDLTFESLLKAAGFLGDLISRTSLFEAMRLRRDIGEIWEFNDSDVDAILVREDTFDLHDAIATSPQCVDGQRSSHQSFVVSD